MKTNTYESRVINYDCRKRGNVFDVYSYICDVLQVRKAARKARGRVIKKASS